MCKILINQIKAFLYRFVWNVILNNVFKDAGNVVKRGAHSINDTECSVKFFVEKKQRQSDTTNRTVIITGVQPPLSHEILELWLEHPKNGGGPINRLDEDTQTHIFTVEFENATSILFCIFYTSLLVM